MIKQKAIKENVNLEHTHKNTLIHTHTTFTHTQVTYKKQTKKVYCGNSENIKALECSNDKQKLETKINSKIMCLLLQILYNFC